MWLFCFVAWNGFTKVLGSQKLWNILIKWINIKCLKWNCVIFFFCVLSVTLPQPNAWTEININKMGLNSDFLTKYQALWYVSKSLGGNDSHLRLWRLFFCGSATLSTWTEVFSHCSFRLNCCAHINEIRWKTTKETAFTQGTSLLSVLSLWGDGWILTDFHWLVPHNRSGLLILLEYVLLWSEVLQHMWR